MSVPAYPNYRESGVRWLRAVPDHWSLKRLAHFFDERRTKVSDKDFPPLSVTKNGIVPQLDTAAKTDDGDNRKLVRAGDFVINSRSDRKGSSGLSELDGSVSLINTVLEPTAEIDGRFSHHLLRSVAFQEEYYRYGKGIVADLWSTNFSEMRNILLALPPLPEQTAIAAFLDREIAKIDALMEEQRRLIELLKEKRQAVISHAVTKGLDPTVPLKESGVEWLGEVPAHWDVVPLKREADFLSGYAFPSADFSGSPEDTPLLRGVNVAVGRTRWEDVVYWRRQEQDGLEGFELRVGDVVLGMDRPWISDGLRVAQITETDLPCLLLQRVAALRPSRDLLPPYLVHLLRSEAFHHHCVPDMTGVSVPHISPTQIGAFVVALPPLEEQQAILRKLAGIIASIEPLVTVAEAAVSLLEERRAALISAAVTGKIDVCASAKVLAFPTDRARARGLIGTEIIERLAQQPTFGRVKLQKIAFLAEAHVGASELAGSYTREAAGPLDRAMIDEMESGARTIAGVTVNQAGGTGTTVRYQLHRQRGSSRQELTSWLGVTRMAELDALIADFADMTTKGSEAVATLYGVWNDALMAGDSPTDGEIIAGFLNDWHPEKRQKFSADELSGWLEWMRRRDIVPTGSGPRTTPDSLFP